MKDFTPEIAALLAVFDWFEACAAECDFPENHRAARRQLIEKYATDLLSACRTQAHVDSVVRLFMSFAAVRSAPGFDRWLANQSDEPVIDAELEDAFVDFGVRNGGIDSWFIEVLWTLMRDSGHEICSVCGQTKRWHLITALQLVTDRRLPLHHFVGARG